ncbi:hypothetical protein FRC04_009886 [Tulasnella sp. 424]|nr:hypothetical protein FRC04_009886 [Tulasnella sp. 424]
MDGINAQEARAQRFSSRSSLQDRYDELSRRRREEIRRMQAASAEDAQRTLDTAVALVGTCQDYCPEFEKVERHLRNEVKRPEMKTVDYLFHNLLPQAPSWISVQEFIFDRTRAIRQDFTIQGGSRGAIAVECHERIARFHILSLHESRIGPEPDRDWEVALREQYSLTLDIEQLNKTLTTLMQYYDDFRAEGVTFPNEAEFRAYRLLLQMRDGDVGRRIQRIPPEVFASPWIQVAIMLRSLLQHPSSAKSGRAPSVPYAFTRLLKELKKPSTSFLMACLVNTHLMTLRKETLRAMAGSYLNISISVPTFQNLLGFNTPGDAEAFATEAGLRILTEKSPREIAVNKSVAQKIASSQPSQSRTQSAWLIEKRGGLRWADIIDGRGPPPGIAVAVAPPTRSQHFPSGTTIPSAPTVPPPTGVFGSTSAMAQRPQALPAFGGTPAFGSAPSFQGSGMAGQALGTKAPPSLFGPSMFGPKAGAGISFGTGSSAVKTSIPSLPTAGAFGGQPVTQPTFAPDSTVAPLAKPIISSSNVFGTKLNASAQEFVPRFFAPPAAQPEVKPAVKVEAAPRPPPPVRRPTITIPESPLTQPVVVNDATTSARKPSLPPLPTSRKSSISSATKPPTPVMPSPRTTSRLEEQKNTALASNILTIFIHGMAQIEVAGAFADEWYRRQRLGPLFRLWMTKLRDRQRLRKEEEERQAQLEQERAQRWNKLMGSLDGGKAPSLNGSTSSLRWKGKGKEVAKGRNSLRHAPVSVEEMQRVVEDVTRAREVMWEPGTFLQAVKTKMLRGPNSNRKRVADHFEFPADWQILLFGTSGPTWKWLRIKFGLGLSGMEDSSYGLGADEYAAVTLVDKEHSRTPAYPGLVVFEIKPSLASFDIAEREVAWSSQLRRLGSVLRRLQAENPYEVGFMVLFWGDTGRDLDEQRDEVHQRVSSYIREFFPSLTIRPEVVAFGSSEEYEETFELALQRTHLDPVGRFLAKHRFQDVVQAYFDAWEASVVDGLIVAESFQVEYPLVKWPAIGRLFSLAIASLQDLEQRACDIIESIVDEPLPSFDSGRVTDEE